MNKAPSFPCLFNTCALARMSSIVSDPQYSSVIGKCSSSCCACSNRTRSEAKVPLKRKRSASIPLIIDNKRITFCSLLISTLKKATGMPFLAILSAIHKATADFPIEGRPAITVSSPLYNPPVRASRSYRPERIRVILPASRSACS